MASWFGRLEHLGRQRPLSVEARNDTVAAGWADEAADPRERIATDSA